MEAQDIASEPIVRYVVSCFSLFGVPQDAALCREMERWLIAEVSRRLVQLGGVWRDPKAVGLYRCALPRQVT